MTDCTICANAFTGSIRKPITCSACNHVCCIQCAKTYLLSITLDPQCMNCMAAWNTEFLATAFNKSFVHNTLKKHRENVLLEREKSMLVATMPMVEHEKQRRRVLCEVAELERELNKQKEIIKNLEININKKKSTLYSKYYKENAQREHREFVRACPATNCKGFLSTQWKCGVCDVKVCNKCHEIKTVDAEHACDPKNVESAELIMKETRPCPKCGVRIFKIEGCDQMWCTSCHTTFSWRTGAVETAKNIHNPHYFEYVRNHASSAGEIIPRALGDVPCGGLPETYILHRHLRKIGAHTHTFTDVLRGLQHVVAVDLMQLDVVNDPRQENTDLRIAYIMGELEEDKWKRMLQIREKARNKKMDMRLILETLIAVSVDIFNRVMTSKHVHELDALLKEFQCIQSHINECFEKHAVRFASSVKQQIHDTTYIMTTFPLFESRI